MMYGPITAINIRAEKVAVSVALVKQALDGATERSLSNPVQIVRARMRVPLVRLYFDAFLHVSGKQHVHNRCDATLRR